MALAVCGLFDKRQCWILAYLGLAAHIINKLVELNTAVLRSQPVGRR